MCLKGEEELNLSGTHNTSHLQASWSQCFGVGQMSARQGQKSKERLNVAANYEPPTTSDDRRSVAGEIWLQVAG